MFLTLIPHGSEQSASHLSFSIPGERDPLDGKMEGSLSKTGGNSKEIFLPPL